MKKSANKINYSEQLHAKAITARKNSYSPYSHYKVGAALLTESGNIYAGCNVENASYGGTICAERSAIFSAVAAEGQIKIKELLVITAEKKPWPPCGFCRQVIAEFATSKTKIHLADENKIKTSYNLAELLPEAFGPSHLTRR